MEKKICSRCGEEKELKYFVYRKYKDRYIPRNYCKECDALNSREYKASRKDEVGRVRRSHLLRKYGLTQTTYTELYNNQLGKCLICRLPPASPHPNLVVDHDHNTGKVRGLLCSNCNAGIGLLRDNPELLMSAYNYLTNAQVPNGRRWD